MTAPPTAQTALPRVAQWLHARNFGGMERFALRLHRALDERGADIRTWYTAGLDVGQAARELWGEELPGVFAQGPLRALYQLWRRPPQVMIHHTGHTQRWLPVLRILLPRTRHIRIFNLGFRRKFDPFHRLVYGLTWRCVFFTQRSRGEGLERLPLRPHCDRVVRFGIDLPPASGVRPRAAGEPLRLTCLSRVDPGKGQRELLLALAAAVRAQPSLGHGLHLRIVGGHSAADAGYVHELEQIIAKEHLDGVVELCGHSTDPQGELAASHALVYASRDELYGFALLEAYAQGIPAICTPRGSFCELHHRSRGWFWDTDDHAATLSLLNELVAVSSEELQQRGAAARRCAERCFRWPASVDRFARILAEGA